eukprot:symbB.v1.2.008928.t1/scaffold563.1/size187063/5
MSRTLGIWKVELRAVRDQQVTNLEIQIKDLRSDLCEILTLKVKPRLASLEKEASETRRRLLPMPTCSVAGEHTAACRHCRRGPATCRAGSPEDWKKARKELQDIGEACAVFQSQIARIEVDGDAEEKERDFLNSHNPHNLI